MSHDMTDVNLAAITVDHVTKSFSDALNSVLNSVSLEIFPGTLNAIIGPSGSGKSTLLHIIAGLELPNQGSVKILADEITDKSEEERCAIRLKSIGQVFQFFHLLPALSAKANAELPGLLLGLKSKKEISERIDSLFDRFNLSHRKDAFPNQLSGGELQRASLIRALCNSPRILLADEPTGNLDSQSGKVVYKLLRECVDELGVAALVVTHDKEIAKLADNTFELKDGVLLKGQVEF
jgi:ABC-type lipoprotein export system ATPase subunit